ncbi:Cupin domain-containing protein [Arachidicoccus rhizosphaerae]|uniref:Cupin domain-containing protein n=1 Tax=Arachidicoccus rhizosphaerae TaxID=551991 RepID=A0A1H3Y0Y2_9BACT|nr:cupin domain-containing protein [Arachidicoccus rhizosphaerae]SEA04741.1 Cupin domain-containing protein [Arachidicoccus rhizosphaerae]
MSTDNPNFYLLPHSSQPVDDQTTRTLLGRDDTLMMLTMDFAQGAVGAMHQHLHTQATYVLKGSFEFTIADEKKIIREGEACFMPSNVMHGCICLEAGRLLDVFTPERKDFL